MTHGRVVKLDPGSRYLRWLASDHEDHALAVYRQGHGRGYPERARIALIVQATENRFFHELRTEREIGYIVFATFMPLLDVPGLALVVQSPSNPPETLQLHVDSFLDRSTAALRDMPRAVFERHRGAVESSLLEEETRLDERTGRYWHAIDREHYEFDRRERLLEAVRAVTRDELVDAWHDLVTGPETAFPFRSPARRPSRGVRRGLGPRASRLGGGVPGRRAGGGCRDVQGQATLLRRVALVRKFRVARPSLPRDDLDWRARVRSGRSGSRRVAPRKSAPERAWR